MKASKIALYALMTALVAVSTIAIRIPIPATGGYFNLGETMVYISAILFGARVGGFAGGVGSSLADLYGFPVFAPITLFVKGIEGFVVGRLSYGRESLVILIISCLAGGVLMVLGYFLAESLMYGIPVALEEVPFNIIQMISGTIISIPTVKALKKVPQIQGFRKP